MRVCVVGSGGREHALATALGRSADVIASPGNPGISGETPEGHTLESTAAPASEIDADLYVIGPEAPLVDGLADRLRAAGRTVFGPGSDGARLEGSKAFMKHVLADAGVPTARWGHFSELDPALSFLKSLPGPWVVKTDGLASGKGVLVADSIADAEDDVTAKLSGEAFGDAGRSVVIEEGLAGTECSIHVVCDGTRVVPLLPARDYKRVGDDDAGPNTGGMGSISPVGAVDDALVGRIVDECVEPVLAALRSRGIDYRGVLYAGLMLTADGPRVLEYNVRFGDPETQVITARTGGDFASLLMSAAAGRLADARVHDADAAGVAGAGAGAAVCVVMAAGGYPVDVRLGDPISGVGAAAAVPGVTLAYAGIERSGDSLVTSGGRVLGVTGTGATLREARDRAYAGVSCVTWDGVHYRTDIGASQ